MKEFYIRSKNTPLITDPWDKESDATMIFCKCCDMSDENCAVVGFFKCLGAVYYAPKQFSSVQRYCFNFDPNKVSIDTLRRRCEEARDILCPFCEPRIERRG